MNEKVRFSHRRVSEQYVVPSDNFGQVIREKGIDYLVGSLATVRDLKLWHETPAAKGGVTICDILHDDEIVATGYAICRPDEAYNKRIGRIKAEGRARGELIRLERNSGELTGEEMDEAVISYKNDQGIPT